MDLTPEYTTVRTASFQKGQTLVLKKPVEVSGMFPMKPGDRAKLKSLGPDSGGQVRFVNHPNQPDWTCPDLLEYFTPGPMPTTQTGSLTETVVDNLLQQLAKEETEKDVSGHLQHPANEDDLSEWDEYEDNEEHNYLNSSCTVSKSAPNTWEVWFMTEGEIEANMPRFSVRLKNGIVSFKDDSGDFEYLDRKKARTMEEFKQILNLP